MRSSIKYLLSLCAILWSWQYTPVVAAIDFPTTVAATTQNTTSQFEKLECNSPASPMAQVLIASHKEFFQWDMIGFIEEEDKWNVCPIHFAKATSDANTSHCLLPAIDIHSYIQQFSRQAAVGPFVCLASRCLAYGVFRI